MKAFTNIDQSKKLAEFLSIGSADGFYEAQHNPLTDKWEYILFTDNKWTSEEVVIPCWSLAALLQIMPHCIDEGYDLLLGKLPDNESWYVCYDDIDHFIYFYIAKSNLIDACVEMIIKLHEEKLL